jgi:hypothetical protein
MAPDEVATKMIFQEQYITLCQYISSRANGFTKVAEDPLNVKIYNHASPSRLLTTRTSKNALIGLFHQAQPTAKLWYYESAKPWVK